MSRCSTSFRATPKAGCWRGRRNGPRTTANSDRLDQLPRGGSGPAPGIGDRVLAKTFPTDDPTGPAYTARVMKIFDSAREAVLGVLRVATTGRCASSRSSGARPN